MSDYFGKDVFKLGFGLMRLPKLEDGSIDVEQTAQMADLFLEAGGTYFDTAYVYNNGESEEVAGKAIVARHPRESFTLATKMNARVAASEEDLKQQIHTSLARTGAGYFDYYLLHAVQRTTYEIYEKYHAWDYLKELKERELIRHCGFSFHADPELLDELLTKHPEVEFVQLQVNYADWENPGVQSRRNLEICKAHGKSVTVMEPVKGGLLADPIPEVKEIFDRENSGLSYPGWAIRFVASQDNILTVLSGMSNLAQMKDNLSFMRNFRPLDEHEHEVIRAARHALEEDKTVPCTGCHYCTEGCPMNIPIPEIFTVVNHSRNDSDFHVRREYSIVTHGRGRASECLQCGQCESVCPQHLPIIRLLEEARSLED
ncbi:MAG: aldo/keto reductase [Lachnospiraceae bacterium]|nr:aldo/keto reductase [Lachnospiraceae bacterium]